MESCHSVQIVDTVAVNPNTFPCISRIHRSVARQWVTRGLISSSHIARPHAAYETIESATACLRKSHRVSSLLISLFLFEAFIEMRKCREAKSYGDRLKSCLHAPSTSCVICQCLTKVLHVCMLKRLNRAEKFFFAKSQQTIEINSWMMMCKRQSNACTNHENQLCRRHLSHRRIEYKWQPKILHFHSSFQFYVAPNLLSFDGS